MNRYKIFVICCLLIFVGCGLFNDPPEITRITVDHYENQPWTADVMVENEVIFTAVVNDEKVEDLSFDWSADAGFFTDKDGGTICWHAPADYGEYGVSVLISDKHDASVSWDTTIKVVQIDGKIFKQFSADPGENKVYSDTFTVDWYMKGRLELDSNCVDLLIMDEANYTEWDQGGSYQLADSLHGSGLDYFSMDVSATGVYYFVLDNPDTLAAQGWLEVLTVSP